MNYKTTWDLYTVPFSAIPDDLLKSWWAKRNGARSGAARIKNDPATEEKRARQRVYSARNRAKGKSQNTFRQAVEGDY
jgi:hypothetical protein